MSDEQSGSRRYGRPAATVLVAVVLVAVLVVSAPRSSTPKPQIHVPAVPTVLPTGRPGSHPEVVLGECTGPWTAVVPSADAGYERTREGKLSPRVDDVEQQMPITEKYKVSYCLHPGRMSGVVRIVRHSALCNVTMPFTEDPMWGDMVRTDHGPDDFHLTLEGMEVQSLAPEHKGDCKYEAKFRVGIAGRYRIGLVASRENYRGSEELTLLWPAQHYDLPIGTAVFVQLGTGGVAEAQPLLKAARSGAGLPECDLWRNSREAYDGRWVFAGADGEDPLGRANRSLASWDRGPMQLTAYVDFHQYVWRPWKCALRSFDPAAARQCLRSKHVGFIGDSHMRVTFRSFVRWACNATFATDRSPKYSGARTCAVNFGECSNTSVCFVWEPSLGAREGADACGKKVKGRSGRGGFKIPQHCLGKRRKKPINFMTSLLSETRCNDLTVVNAGHQPASGEYRWHFARYRRLVDQLNAQRGLNPGLVWRETNAMPFRKDVFVGQKHDRRTEARLRLWSRWAREQFLLSGVPLIPSFWATAAFILGTEDNAHFPQPLNWNLSPQFFLSLLCPSQDRPAATKPTC